MSQQTDQQILDLIAAARTNPDDLVRWDEELKIILQNIVDSKPNNEVIFTILTGTTWDGSNKYKTLTANLALTLSTSKTAGLLYIAGNSSYTLTINGTAITINNTGDSIVGFIKQNGIYVITTDLSPVALAAGDVTAPTVVSATAINANTIRIVFSEAMGAVTIAGHSFKQNGVAITPDTVTGATTTWDFVVSETMLSSDTLLRSYNSATGATTDVATNELVSYTDQSVTNSIAGPVTYVTDNFSGGDDVDIAGRSTITGGGTWTAVGANTGLIKIETGVARLNTASLIAKYYVTGTIRNLNTRVTIGTAGADVYGLLAYTDESNYIQVNLQTGNTYQFVAGVATQLIVNTYTAVNTDIIRVELNGVNLTVYKNAVSVATTAGVSASLTGTNQGIYFYQQAGPTISNFETYAL